MGFCKYKDIFGEPGKGVHAIRVGNIAIIDVLLTIVLGLSLAYALKVNFILITIMLFLLAIVLHHIFCVKTTVDKALFGDKHI